MKIKKMNQQELQQKIGECYSTLTPEVQAVFSNMEWLKTLQSISEKYGLIKEQTETLGTETTLVLLGIIPFYEYEERLRSEIKLSKDSLDKILEEIDASILGAIHPELTKVFYRNNKPTTDSLKQKIKENLIKSPKEFQELINASSWEKISEEIGKSYLLDESQINDLQDQIGLTIADIFSIDLLFSAIKNYVGINEEVAKNITEEVIKKILRPIYNKLTENIKTSLKNKNIHWQQNLNFILSGGDYTAFIREPAEEKRFVQDDDATFNRSKIDDLKSKFTI